MRLQVGQRVKLLDKTIGESKEKSLSWERYHRGVPMYIVSVKESRYSVYHIKDFTTGDKYAFGDVVPYSSIDEDSEEL